MAAPKQPSPRALSPDIPVVSYPTPNTGDLLVVQDVDTRTADYVAASYGDPHPDVAKYPNLKLVYQTPLDNEQNHMWVRRVYANERFNQEAYNYAQKYSGEDPSKPIYVRTYTLPRDTYEPLAKGTPDPIYAGAVLVEEAADRIKDDQTDGQLDSLFIKVTRVYETLPGPGLVTVKKGSANSIPQKFQAARQVTVTKTTVPASTTADDTSETLVESSVEQATVAKAQKINSVLDSTIVTLIGEKVTPQQQVATVSEKMVPTGSGQDVVEADAFTLDGSVDNLGNGQSVVTKVQAPRVFPETQLSVEKPLWGIPMKFKVADPPVKTSHVEAGIVSQADVAFQAPQEMDRSAEQTTEFKKKVSVSTMSGNPVSLTGSQTGPFGGELVTEELLYGEQPTADVSFGTKEESFDPTGDGRTVHKKVSHGTQSQVVYHTDEQYRIVTKITKTIVDPSTYPEPTPGPNESIELIPIDPKNAIEVKSEVVSLPQPEEWSHTIHYSFPDILLEAGVYFQDETKGSASSGGVNNAAVGESTGWRAQAGASAQAVIRAIPYTRSEAGYSGPCPARTVRRFYLSSPAARPEPVVIKPVSGAIVITGRGGSTENSNYLSGNGGTWLESGGTIGGSSDVTAIRHALTNVVHNISSLRLVSSPVATSPSSSDEGSTTGLTLLPNGSNTYSSSVSYSASSGTIPDGAYPAASASMTAEITATLELPPSTAPIASGTEILVDVKTEKWRLGVWMQEFTYITRP